jgi:hypothetical protein
MHNFPADDSDAMCFFLKADWTSNSCCQAEMAEGLCQGLLGLLCDKKG